MVRKCLEKDPDDRWQSARDVKAELQWIAEGGSQVGLPGDRRRRGAASRAASRGRRRASPSLAAVGFAVAWVRRAPKPAPVVRFADPDPRGRQRRRARRSLSPDGRMLAFDAADATGKRQIWMRPLDALEARPLPGTEGALRPIWSPDSRFDRVHGRGQAAQGGRGRRAAADDLRRARRRRRHLERGRRDPVRRPRQRPDLACRRRPAACAKPEVTPTPRRARRGGWPEFLPDGRHFLYMSCRRTPEDRR